MSTVKSKNLQVGTDATATNNFTIYQPGTPDGTLRIGVGNADSPTEVAQFNSTGIVGDGSQLTGLPASGLGIGQTWQLVTGSRAASTTYTNTTGKPIAISIRAETTSTTPSDALFVVGGVNAWNRYCGSIASARFSIMAIVPTGATYSLTIPTGTVFDQWAELR